MPDLRPLLLDSALGELPAIVHDAGIREAAAFALALQDFLTQRHVPSRLLAVERQGFLEHGERLAVQRPLHVLVEAWGGHWDVHGRGAEEAYDGSYLLREISRAELLGKRAALGKTDDDRKTAALIGQVLVGRVVFPGERMRQQRSREAESIRQGSRGREEGRSR